MGRRVLAGQLDKSPERGEDLPTLVPVQILCRLVNDGALEHRYGLEQAAALRLENDRDAAPIPNLPSPNHQVAALEPVKDSG